MTALTFSPSVEPANATKLTLKSIKKYSSSSVAKDSNPLTLHAVDEELFPRFWSLMAEVMLVEGFLENSSKETIAWLVNKQSGISQESSKTKHRSNGDPFAAATQNEAIKYAESLLQEGSLEDSSRLSHGHVTYTLSRCGKAEAALVVLLFTHLNRSAVALLGDQDLSKAMASLSTSNNVPADVDYTSPKGVLKAVNRMISSPQPNKPGITAPLFPSTNKKVHLPEHLQAVGYTSSEVVRALARVVSWVDNYQEQLMAKGILTCETLSLLEHMEPPSKVKQSGEVAQWVSSPDMVNNLKSLPNQAQIVARVLLLVKCDPASVSSSRWWTALYKAMGKETGTSIVLWWSLHLTLEQAQGLENARRNSNESSSHRGLKRCSHQGYNSV